MKGRDLRRSTETPLPKASDPAKSKKFYMVVTSLNPPIRENISVSSRAHEKPHPRWGASPPCCTMPESQGSANRKNC